MPLSQAGISADVKEGDDVTAKLDITKYEPPIPGQMSGQVYSAGLERTVRYDIENYKAFPEVLRDGEPVVFTEKIHGTWCQIGVLPTSLADATHGPLVVSSKGRVVGAVVGEYLGSAAGLGYLIHQAEGVFDVTGVFAGMLSPFQPMTSKPFRPSSSKVGTSGNWGCRVLPVSARISDCRVFTASPTSRPATAIEGLRPAPALATL